MNTSIRAYGHGLSVDSVDEALALGLDLVRQLGVPVVSRGLETLEVPGPVMTVYHHPMNRVCFDPVRDANPFFHFFEALWILSGGKKVDMPSYFLSSLKQFSDDGTTFHGAYGDRLRNWGGMDQVGAVVDMLRAQPDTRKAVCSIWDPGADLGKPTKDTPCNDMITFKVRDDALNMTVFNRSNDVIWGAYGANVVQFSMIQDFVAASLGLHMGHYTQVSDSYHVYPSNPTWQKYASGEWTPEGHVYNEYDNLEGMTDGARMFRDPTDAAIADVEMKVVRELFENGVADRLVLWGNEFKSYAVHGVARHMLAAYIGYKAGDFVGAMQHCSRIEAWDWRLACGKWIDRRFAAKAGA